MEEADDVHVSLDNPPANRELFVVFISVPSVLTIPTPDMPDGNEPSAFSLIWNLAKENAFYGKELWSCDRVLLRSILSLQYCS